MTLAIAWVRQLKGVEELIFASDSRLSAGQDWDCCPKIIPLLRSDSAICFAGDTNNAYPSMLQLQHALEIYPKARSRAMDIHDFKGHVLRVLNNMRDFISDLPKGQNEPGDP